MRSCTTTLGTARSRIVLLRHGRTQWNAIGRLQGHSDVPLDPVGVEQAGQAAQRLTSAFTFGQVVSSDLIRAVDTAQAVAQQAGVAVNTDARLRERSFGFWEGLTREEILERWPHEYGLWRAGHDLDAPQLGIESRAHAAYRYAQAVVDHAAACDASQDLLVVSHGAVTTVGITALLGMDAGQWKGLGGLDNAHWTVLEANSAGASPSWRLTAHNVG